MCGLRKSRKGSGGHIYLQKQATLSPDSECGGNRLHVLREAAAKSLYKESCFQGEGSRTVASFPIFNIPIIMSSQLAFANMFS